MNSYGIELYKNASPFSHRDKVLVRCAENQIKRRNVFVLVVLVSVVRHSGWQTGRGNTHKGGVEVRDAARGQALPWGAGVTASIAVRSTTTLESSCRWRLTPVGCFHHGGSLPVWWN